MAELRRSGRRRSDKAAPAPTAKAKPKRAAAIAGRGKLRKSVENDNNEDEGNETATSAESVNIEDPQKGKRARGRPPNTSTANTDDNTAEASTSTQDTASQFATTEAETSSSGKVKQDAQIPLQKQRKRSRAPTKKKGTKFENSPEKQEQKTKKVTPTKKKTTPAKRKKESENSNSDGQTKTEESMDGQASSGVAGDSLPTASVENASSESTKSENEEPSETGENSAAEPDGEAKSETNLSNVAAETVSDIVEKVEAETSSAVNSNTAEASKNSGVSTENANNKPDTEMSSTDGDLMKGTTGEKPDGEKPDGEKPDGEKPDGEKPDGEKPDGENSDGEKLEAERVEAKPECAPESDKPKEDYSASQLSDSNTPEENPTEIKDGLSGSGSKPKLEIPSGKPDEDEDTLHQPDTSPPEKKNARKRKGQQKSVPVKPKKTKTKRPETTAKAEKSASAAVDSQMDSSAAVEPQVSGVESTQLSQPPEPNAIVESGQDDATEQQSAASLAPPNSKRPKGNRRSKGKADVAPGPDEQNAQGDATQQQKADNRKAKQAKGNKNSKGKVTPRKRKGQQETSAEVKKPKEQNAKPAKRGRPKKAVKAESLTASPAESEHENEEEKPVEKQTKKSGKSRAEMTSKVSNKKGQARKGKAANAKNKTLKEKKETPTDDVAKDSGASTEIENENRPPTSCSITDSEVPRDPNDKLQICARVEAELPTLNCQASSSWNNLDETVSSRESETNSEPTGRYEDRMLNVNEPDCAGGPPIGNKYVGAHVSITGGLHQAVDEAVSIRARSFGLFLKSQRTWKHKELGILEADQFIDTLRGNGYSPHMVVPHGGYLMNLAAPDADKRKRSLDMLVHELQLCERLGLPIFNFHPGSTTGETSIREGIEKIADGINTALKKTTGVIAVLENMACQGHTIGGKFEELRDIIELVDDKSRIGVCFDTCHAVAAGYDLTTRKGYEETMRDFANIVGFRYLKAVHINDSKGPIGSHLDRHEDIGKGTIGKEGFSLIMNDPRLNNIPFILETPAADVPYDKQIKTLYKYCE